MPSYTQEPSKTVKEKFSATSTTRPAREERGVVPTKGKPVGGQAALPPPVSLAQIEGMYEPLRKEIEALPPPAAQPVPPQTKPLAAFLSVLGANLGASLLRNPQVAQQATEYLLQKEQERKATVAQNYATDLAFNQNKRNQLVQIRGQALETALKAALESNDSERAAKIGQNLAKLQGEIQTGMVIPAAGKEELKQIEETGRQARMTQAERIRLEWEKAEGIATKPLTPQQFQKAIDDVNKNKELTTEEHGFFGNIWRSLFGGENKLSKRDMLKGAYVTGLIAGEPAVQGTAKRRLTTMVVSELGLLKKYPDPNTPFSPEDEQKVLRAFADLGLNYQTDVAPIK
jgi:hypothetical protein